MSVTDVFVHLLSRLAIGALPPAEAKRWVEVVVSRLTPLDIEAAESLARQLRHGTCLSRAIAVAARLPASEVVIGSRRSIDGSAFAHAWVECGETRIGNTEGTLELARFR